MCPAREVLKLNFKKSFSPGSKIDLVDFLYVSWRRRTEIEAMGYKLLMEMFLEH